MQAYRQRGGICVQSERNRSSRVELDDADARVAGAGAANVQAREHEVGEAG